MTTTVKRLLYVIAFTAFFAAGPALILYTWGYRYDFQHGRAVVTGVLYLKSYPRRANVTLNGRTLPSLTPTQISGLVPGGYAVTVSRPGTVPWRKELVIYPERVTFAEDIVLFRSRPVLSPIVSGTATQLEPSPDGRSVALMLTGATSTSPHLEVLDTESGASVLSRSFGKAYRAAHVTWSYGNRRILISTATEAQVAVVGNPLLPITLSAPPGGAWRSLAWDRRNDDVLLAANQRGLWRYDLTDRGWVSVGSASVLGIDTADTNGASLAVVASGTTAWLAPWPTSTSSWLVPLSSSTSRAFGVSTGALGWTTVTERGGSTWLIDTATATPQVTRAWPEARQVRWRADGLALAVLHSGGVSLFSFDDDWSDEIRAADVDGYSDVQWYPGGTHLYLSRHGSLEVAELDPRPIRNIARLWASSGFGGAFAVTRISERLLIVESGVASGTPAGLYSATVQ